jgi:hypothetical protein
MDGGRRSFFGPVLGVAIILGVAASNVEVRADSVNGHPAPGAKKSVNDLDTQVAYQRAFEAVLWAMPASAIYRFRVGFLQQPGMADNVIDAFSGPAHTSQEAITPNQVTPYIIAVSDLRKGPVVLEVPAKSEKASLYGQVVDAWQATIADVGPAGVDKGAGGKYLFLPPGYKETTPEGYFVIPSTSYRITYVFRSVAAPSATVEDAYAYSKTLKLYPFSEAASPTPTRFVDGLQYGLQPRYVGFIPNPIDRASLGSPNLSAMKRNSDGSVDLYFGPKAPPGLESNWIPTMGQTPYLWLRLYGPSEAFWNKTFKMPDVELVR